MYQFIVIFTPNKDYGNSNLYTTSFIFRATTGLKAINLAQKMKLKYWDKFKYYDIMSIAAIKREE